MSIEKGISDYALGHASHEIRRLEIQGQIFLGGTDRILKAADLREGQSVLDIGTGAGDVALSAANIIGGTGTVLGIDLSPTILATAQNRAEQALHHNLRFEAASLADFQSERLFDFVVGRYVLVHQEDQVEFIRRAASLVRPGGTLLFIEPNINQVVSSDGELGEIWSRPAVPLYNETVRLVIWAFKLAGVDLSCGGRLLDTFQAAGLAEPELRCEVPMAGPRSECAEWITLTLRSLLPILERQERALAADIQIETLQARLTESMIAARSQLRFADLVGAWTKVW